MGIYKIRNEFGHHLKLLMGVLAFIFVIGGVFTFGYLPKLQGGGPGSGDVIATVNGMEITRSEYESAWEKTLEGLKGQQGMRSTLALARARGQMFQQVLNTRVAAVTAEKLGVTVSPKDVAAKRDEMMLQGLRDSRRQVLGKISREQELTDPRRDPEYKAELAKSTGPSGSPMTVDQIEQGMARFISDAQIQQGLAMDGIRKALKAKAGTVTPQEVTNSFNVYAFRVIAFSKNLPAAQLNTQVNKVDDLAKKGSDFVALAKQYSKDKEKGAVQNAEYGRVGSGVWNTLTGMKPGQISNPIDAGDSIYIVKLETATQKLPAKFDKKAQDDRRAMIENSRMTEEFMKVQTQLKKDLKVNVTDPEMKGYYAISQAQQATTPAEAMSQLRIAQKAFEDATVKQSNNAYASAMLADVLRAEGNNDKAAVVLYQLLEGNGSSGYGADLRLMLGDLVAKKGKKADAAVQYTKASEAAGMDVEAHKLLASRFKAVGKPDLAAKETALAADYAKKLKILQDRQTKANPAGAPVAPKPGQ